MHNAGISQEILALNLARCGRRLAFEIIDPQRVAYVVIDLQNGFVEACAPLRYQPLQPSFPRCTVLAVQIGAAGGRNIFLRFTCDLGELTR